MSSLLPLPETPRRGRSRFSKVLPQPPPQLPERSSDTLLTFTSKHSPLPPRPKDAPPLVMSIPRRPIGMTAEQKALSRALAAASNSPMLSEPPGLSRSTTESSSGMDDSPKVNESESIATPPIPPKDTQRKGIATPPPPPAKDHDDDIPSAFQALQDSPPKLEIWRRRSVRSDRSLPLRELKLERSNGSTASPPRQEPPKEPLPYPPRNSSNKRKPVPVRPAPPQPEFMGNKLAKLKDKDSRSRIGSSSKDNAGYEASSARYPSPNIRPPTPEYLKTDGKLPDLPPVLSPRSPDTPPEETRPEIKTPQIPIRSDSRNVLASRLADTISDENNRLGTPDIDPSHSRQSSDTLTITSPQPSTELSMSSQTTLIPPQRTPSDEKTSPLVLPSPVILHFPTVSTPAPEGTIFDSLPLSEIQLDCYQSHRFMRGTKNVFCPTACMVCTKRDKEVRWRCNWCCLSACGACMQVLSTVPGKDLRVAMQRLEVAS